MMKVTRYQEHCVQQLLTEYKSSNIYLRRSSKLLRQSERGSNTYHWTQVFSTLWRDRIVGNNAKCFDILKQIYYDPNIPMILKIRQLDVHYQPILNKLKYYEDIAYSNRYILDLHIQTIFDEIEPTDCVKHNDISEYKDIEIEMNECFCKSQYQQTPRFCLYCRDPTHYIYTKKNQT